MNYLTALLAFAAIMIVLTTLATVVVEGIHKIMRKRASDFEHLVLQLYNNAIKPQLLDAGVSLLEDVSEPGKSEAGKGRKGSRFVEQLTQNPAFDPKRRSFFEKIPVIRNLFDRSLQELTTRQFVEQFAQTDAGKAMMKAGDQTVSKLIGKFSYEFERYGEAASTYFQRRASVLSVIVAFFIAFSLNIEAFKLFGALARDDQLASQVITNIDVAKLEAAYLERLEAASAAGGQDGNVDPARAAGEETNPDEAANIKAEYQAILDHVKSEAATLEGLGLPIGMSFFPYCSVGIQTVAGAATSVDARCDAVPPASSFKVDIPLIGGVVTGVGRWLGDAYARLTTQAGLGWFFSVLISGGLIGLGAPFWFKTYQFVADFIPGVTRPDSTLARQRKTGKAPRTGAVVVGGTQPPPRSTLFPASILNVSPASATAGPASGASAPPSGTEPVSLDVVSDAGLSEADLFEAFSQTSRPPSDR